MNLVEMRSAIASKLDAMITSRHSNVTPYIYAVHLVGGNTVKCPALSVIDHE